LGALMLGNMSGLGVYLRIYAAHPYLQIFGFLAEFVCGVAYSVVPLFKSRKVPNLRVAYLLFFLITIANILSIAAVLESGSYYNILLDVTSFLVLLSSIIFAYQVIDLVGRPSKILGEGEPFLSLSASSFLLVSLVFFLNTAFPTLLSSNGELFTFDFLYLSLVGFVGSMIYGVELKTTVFRMTNYRKNFARAAVYLQAISIMLAFVSSFKGLSSNLLSWPLYISALLCTIFFAISIKIFEMKRSSKPLMPVTSGNSNVASHQIITFFTDVSVLSSVLWLLFSLVLAAAWILFGIQSFALRDTFIHSMAIGFIGSAVTAYGPVLLPGVLSMRAPKKHLSFLPLLFLNSGLLIRIAGDFYSSGQAFLPLWESSSGGLIIAAMILFIIETH